MEKPPPGTIIFIIYISAAIFLLSLSALFSISESSLLGMNKLRLRIKRKSGDKKAMNVSKLLEKKDLLINTLLAANDLVNIVFSSLLTVLAISLFGQKGIGIATASATVLLLIFGEIIPKTISTKNPDTISYTLSPFIKIVLTIFKPVAIFFTTIAHFFLKIFGVVQKKDTVSFTEDDIKTVLDIALESGVLEKTENTMMNKVFKFTDLATQEIMTPRPKIVAFPATVSYDELISKSKETGFSRFPIYKTDIDHIVGVLYIKDLLTLKMQNTDFLPQNVMRPPVFVLGSKKMSSLQEVLYESKQTLAIVIDEYAGTDGIVTQEDISKNIFGLSVDKKNESAFTKIDGTTLLSNLKDMLSIPINSEMSDTLGGWIEEKLDIIPNVNDFVKEFGYIFTVLEMDGNRVKTVLAQKINEAEK